MIHRVLLLVLCLAGFARAELAGFATQSAPTNAGTLYAIGHATGATPDVASSYWADASTTFDDLTCAAHTAPGTGNSWTVDVFTAPAGSNTFVDQLYSCVLHDAVFHCRDNSHSTAWVQDGSLAFQITTVGTPPANDFLTCAVRVAGGFTLHMEAIAIPASGTVTAFGSFGVNVSDDYQAMMPLEGGASATALRLSCITNIGIPSGSVNVRVRHGTGPTFGWTNSPINCTLTGAATVVCTDLINTQHYGGQDAVSYLLTVSGTMPAGLVVRCGTVLNPYP